MDGEMVRPSVVTLFLALVNARMFQGIQTSLRFESTQLENCVKASIWYVPPALLSYCYHTCSRPLMPLQLCVRPAPQLLCRPV